MNKKDALNLPKYTGKGNPLFKDLPDYVKDHANFDKIQRALVETLSTRHSHAEVLKFYECKNCMSKVADHKNMMIKFGFTNPATYRAWVKVHQTISKRFSLPKYDE